MCFTDTKNGQMAHSTLGRLVGLWRRTVMFQFIRMVCISQLKIILRHLLTDELVARSTRA